VDVGPHKGISHILGNLRGRADDANSGRQDAVAWITDSDSGNLSPDELGIDVVETNDLGATDEEVVGTHERAAEISQTNDDHVIETVVAECFIDLNLEGLNVIARAARSEGAESREVSSNRSGRNSCEITEALGVSLSQATPQHLLRDSLIDGQSRDRWLRQLAIAIEGTRHNGNSS
jgi:hypothetical protein